MSRHEAINGPEDRTSSCESARQLYLVAEAGVLGAKNDEFDLGSVLRVIWSGRWHVAIVATLMVIVGASYALFAQPWYRAEVVLAPNERVGSGGLASQLSQLGGLASLAGFAFSAPQKGAPLAVLQSRSFAQRFIEDERLLPAFFPEDWDPDQQAWKAGPDHARDARDGVRYFLEKVLRVSEDKRSGLVTVTVDWRDPQEAAIWANLLAERVNAETRASAIADAERNIAFLREELSRARLVAMQQAIGRLMEVELQKYMLAKGASEYSYRVVDPATTPKKPRRPRRALVVALSLLLGIAMGSGLVYKRAQLRSTD